MSGSHHSAAVPRILPEITEINRAFWTGGERGQLLILRNRKTGRWVHPPETVTPADGDLVPEAVSGKGSVFTFTVNHHPYDPSVPVPYLVALVELDEQAHLRMPTNLVNCDIGEVHIGMRVRVLFEQQGAYYVPLFEPDR